MALHIGLTGGVAAGKSTVSRRLVARGAELIDADVLAREVVAAGTPGLAQVRAEFGPGVIAPDGTLDRAAVARMVFGDDERRRALEAIIHPRVAARRAELQDALPETAIVVNDIPLLVENGYAPGFHLVLVVHADASERARRLVADRGMDESAAWDRIRAQASDEQRRAAADVWLDNTGDVAALEATVDELWESRLVPYEANLRRGVPAARARHAALSDPDPSWPEQAARVIARIRHAIGDRALRVDHIGSTAVPGLAAKDVLDVQIVVADLAEAHRIAGTLTPAGLVDCADGQPWYDNGSDGTTWHKAMAQNADPARPVNCHIRPHASPAWRDVLALRDYLRAHPAARDEYGRLKREWASMPHDSIDEYADRKGPWIRTTLEHAASWAREPAEHAGGTVDMTDRGSDPS